MMNPHQLLAAILAFQDGGATPPVKPGVPGAVVEPQTFGERVVYWVQHQGVNIALALLLFAAAWMIAGWVRRAIRRGTQRARVDPTLSKFLSNLARWAIVAIAIVMCLQRFGIETTSFAALIGAAGLAIGLGFQGSLGHFAAGVMLLLFRPFKVGDTVTVAGQQGIVNEIDLLITEIDTPDGRRVVIPNGQIFGSIIENTSHHPRRRVDVTVNVPADAAVDRTREVLEQLVNAVRPRLDDPAPEVAVNEVTHVYVGWVLRVWVLREDYGDVRQQLLSGARRGLEEAGLIKVNLPEGAAR